MSLALFDLDNTLIDRAGAFRQWASKFTADRALGQKEVEWLERVDDDGFAPRNEFFEEVRQRYELAESVDDLGDLRGRWIAEARVRDLSGGR